jgi:hypothetical protein
MGIAPPGQEGWREAPGWWFNHCVESSLYSEKGGSMLIAKPYPVLTLLLTEIF